MKKLPKRKVTVRYNDPTPEGAAKRRQQAEVDSEIEGMAPVPDYVKAYEAQLEAEGVTGEEWFTRMGDYIREKNSAAGSDT